MPRRDDIRSILLLGSGPIIIGQACEFDYSGTQACKALREEGYKVILVNSNPATIMTDPELSDRTYIEPITADMVERVIARERPDALLCTMGGQTALNVAIELADSGVLAKYGVQMLGTNADVIRKAEDRRKFKEAMVKIGLDLPRSDYAYTLEQAHAIRERIGLPCVVRTSFTLGGTGGGIAYNVEEFHRIVADGIEQSMIHEVLIEESVYGWKEFELEVMRDRKDNVIIVCSIENFDSMGIHTGDSITVAPVQTLTDREYQLMRDAAIRVIREIGVETGGSNIQFAVDPKTGRMVVIEMNPRVSRSSALASKATGFPIARIAAKLAVGYTLDELPNDMTKVTPASFEPTLDYVVVKIPRWAFEKFPEADPTLTIQMKSVGEVMAIGRTFKEALQKAVRGLEYRRAGLGFDRGESPLAGQPLDLDTLRENLTTPTPDRLYQIRQALKVGMPVEEVAGLTRVDPWFLANIEELVRYEDKLRAVPSLADASPALFREAKRLGYSDAQLAKAWKSTEPEVRSARRAHGIHPTYKRVDTCAAEFASNTSYFYSTYEEENELVPSDRPRVVILGGGPNRIGQGIEFDYCCVQASMALREMGFETVMVNSNPETVSTDYDTSDLLFFEPVTTEDVLNLCDQLRPIGVIVQLGGQTPLNLARSLADAGVKIVGTSVDSIERAEDRKKFNELVDRLHLVQPPGGIARDYLEARQAARTIGYPVLVRPSFVLGGRAMRIVYDEESLERFVLEAAEASPDRPILIDKFIEDAIEVDVDAICDGTDVFIAGIMEHIEEAGVHSGDATMTLPPFSLSDRQIEKISEITGRLARELQVCGLMNVQFAVKDNLVYILEVNPRASRTVPFVGKATGVPVARIGAQVMLGKKLADFHLPPYREPDHFSVKHSVFPFRKFAGVDVILGPEMLSTGEVMGTDRDFGRAYAKAAMAAGLRLPKSGKVFLSVKDADKRDIIFIAKKLIDLGFEVLATAGTRKVLERNGIPVKLVPRIKEGRPNALDLIINRELALIINTPSGKGPRTDEGRIRAAAVSHDLPVITTIPGAQAAVNGIEAMLRQDLEVRSLQEYHAAKAPVAPVALGS